MREPHENQPEENQPHENQPEEGRPDENRPDAAGEATQDEPLMEQNVASNREKLDGIIVQTINDLGARHPLRDLEAVVRERSAASELGYSDGEIAAAVGDAVREAGIGSTDAPA